MTQAITEHVRVEKARLIIQLRKLSASSHMWCRAEKKKIPIKACSHTQYGWMLDGVHSDTGSHLPEP